MKEKSFSTLIRKVGIALLPVFLLLVCYVHCDPFRVLRTYGEYQNKPMVLNQGFINWQCFLNNRDSLNYDSYLLGNSCTMAYPTDIWKPFLKEAKPIRLYGNSESLYAIWKKVRRLDEMEVPMKNVLLLLDYGTLRKVLPSINHTHVLHPDISGVTQFEFQKEFFVAFFNPKILMSFLDYHLCGEYRKYMKGIIQEKDDHRNQFTNDIINPREFEIRKDPEGYWEQHRKEFPKREEGMYGQIIKSRQQMMLNEIREIFQRHGTDYRIVINPEWKQKKFNTDDLAELKMIFGSDRVFDFSGKNQYTENKEFFYEKSHYRPLLGKIILEQIYKQKTNEGNWNERIASFSVLEKQMEETSMR